MTQARREHGNARPLTVVDLFSGCGGMSWGLELAGFTTVAGIDHWKPATNTFALNHPRAAAIEADLTELTPAELLARTGARQGEIDCLIGGPPCQGFSKNVPAAYRFLEDPRNLLFRYYLDFVAALQPRVVVMENVAEIYKAYDGAVRDEILATLDRLGYRAIAKVVVASDYGVPQVRRRCLFFASRTSVPPRFPDPSHGPGMNDANGRRPYTTAWAAISDLPRLENGEGCEPMDYDLPPQNDYQALMRCRSEELFDHITRRLNEKQFSRIASIGPGEGLRELPEHLRPASGYSGAYGRLDFEMLAPTITRWVFHPGSGRFCHPREPRLLTIREAARLQSFTDDFRFTGTYIEKAHQVGNAVPPLLMRAMAPAIRACCEGAG
jgi:DNA (cytosine-5)-methyltransferase 1